MKTYNLILNGNKYEFIGIVDDVKESILDVVVAKELSRLHRQFKKGLLEADVLEISKQTAMGLAFGCAPVVNYLSSEEGANHLIGETGLRNGKPVDAADIEAIREAQQIDGSDTFIMFQRMFADSAPQKKTEKVSPPSTPPACETSSSGSS